jgi:hypothetical protein
MDLKQGNFVRTRKKEITFAFHEADCFDMPDFTLSPIGDRGAVMRALLRICLAFCFRVFSCERIELLWNEYQERLLSRPRKDY